MCKANRHVAMTTTRAALRFPLPADWEIFVLSSTPPPQTLTKQTCPLSRLPPSTPWTKRRSSDVCPSAAPSNDAWSCSGQFSLTPLIYFSLLSGSRVHIHRLLCRHGTLPSAAPKTQMLSDSRAGDCIERREVLKNTTLYINSQYHYKTTQ